MVLSLRVLCIVNKEGIKLNRVKVNIGEISLNGSDYDKVQKLMKNWDMTIEEFCKYAVVSIAETHDSKRALKGKNYFPALESEQEQ